MHVKLKKFNTRQDGIFNLVTLSEIDVLNQVVTGRYIILKLSEQKDLEFEQSMLMQKEK